MRGELDRAEEMLRKSLAIFKAIGAAQGEASPDVAGYLEQVN